MTLKIYSTDTCPWCVKAKQWMTGEGIAYEEVNVTHDQTLQRELLALTGQRTVPVIAEGKNYVVGFDPAGIKRLAAGAPTPSAGGGGPSGPPQATD